MFHIMPSRIVSVCAGIGFITGLGIATLGFAQGSVRKLEPSTGKFSCSRFQWGADENSDKAIMRVPIGMNGKHYWYQFDTGADVVAPYGAGEHRGWTTHGTWTRIPKVEFAGMSLPAILAIRMKNITDKSLQGTVGLDILVGHTLVIDFPKQRICMMNRADLPDSVDEAADWTRAEIRDGKFYIRAKLNGKKLDALLYDTGSSPDELSVDFDLWKEASGKAGANDASSRQHAQSLGEQVEIISARATGDLVIGKHRYEHPRLSNIVSRPSSYHDNCFGAQGALGNALFFNSIVILDLGAHPRFGIISLERA